MSYIAPDLSVGIVLLEQTGATHDLSLDVIMCKPIVVTQNIYPKSFRPSEVSSLLSVKSGAHFLLPQSIQSEAVSSSLGVRISNNNLGLVVLERRGVYPGFIWGVVLRQKGEVDVDITLTAYSFDAGSIPKNHRVELSIMTIAADGIPSNSGFGQADLYSNRQFVSSIGFYATAFGLASTVNVSRQLWAKAFTSSLFGKPLTYNLKQFAPAQGKDQSLYGTPYMQGGVRWLNAYSIAPLGVGSPKLLNTTANQYAYPSGIARTAVVPAPIITPHMIYARGIYGTLFGDVKVVPTPVLKHKGVNHFEAGKTTVWFHTRPLSVNGFESFDAGYPKVFDPTQYFSPSPTLRSSVFGDVRIRNNNSYLRAPSIDSQAISEWATVEARDRTLYAKSFVAQAFGNQSIKNKSPSIFFNGLPAPIFYNQAIGYRIRKIAPTGFDRLLLGSPTVIKTPELKPNGLIATQFGTQWISNHTRYIENNSKDHSSAGTPTIWFRFRYAYPKSWQSSTFSDKLTVTHGVREVIASGFIQEGYGVAWVSPSIRLLEPVSIVKKQQAGNHYVGRHQEIKPFGFDATRFGTRIIPDITAVYPQGFAGVFGLALADLATNYLNPKGFATAGEQPAFRWGRQIVYNSDQYITQEFDGGSGLVPPKWSDWQSIENRNKTIRTIGTAMQKFGYAQIDNHARLIEPQGLVATKFSPNMIAYRIRHLPLQGIEAPYMAGWHVVHNEARVIKPMGEVQSLFGNADVVKTRRYLDRIGRIESFEAGTPMIAYRIRKLEIEKRYSIAPPIIRLPTVGLYTRYVEFRGYETAKYGLASLSIHFRIITPRWSHREKAGNPALRNVTPELLIRGHDSQEYGQASIRTQWRHVYAQGDDSSAIGLLKISDTKQYIAVRGFIDSLASQKHTVTQGASAPYSLQYIYLNDENNTNSGEGKGIKPPDNQVPSASLNQNVIYHRSESASSKFGTQFIWGNNLVIESGIAIDGVSTGLEVRNNYKVISLDGKGINNKIECGKPRLSPHTIYAVKEAPLQARMNHQSSNLHYVGEDDRYPPGERFGQLLIESTIRSIYPRWSRPSSDGQIGRASIELSRKIVSPNGFRLGRFGVPSIPFTDQEIVLRQGIDNHAFGMTAMSRPPYVGPQYINMQSIYSAVFGSTYADNYVRTLSAKGADSLAMGMSKQSDSPFMWQGLRVGEHVPSSIGAGDTSRHGETTIWHRVREINVEGFDAFRSEYQLSAFDERMTVSNADKQLPENRTLEIISISPASAIGYQDIKLGQRYIRPDGNSDQFRKGGYHA